MKIEEEHLVLNLEKVKQILNEAYTISVMDCGCRKARGNCDAPINVCIDMDQIAERNIANNVAREITLDEAMSILEMPTAVNAHDFYGIINSSNYIIRKKRVEFLFIPKD